jgi:hypothetical protein
MFDMDGPVKPDHDGPHSGGDPGSAFSRPE